MGAGQGFGGVDSARNRNDVEKMRVLSMVPSWTETLLEAGVDLVGRTRFCVHPQPAVKSLPVVGGTKDVDWEKVRALRPDLLILDREENPKFFADQSPVPVLDTHVTSIESLIQEFRRLADELRRPFLREASERVLKVWERGPRQEFPWPPPGALQSVAQPESGELTYVIWKNPWMAVGDGTYIASVLDHLGARRKKLPPGPYPEISQDVLASGLNLFSSEPFPFHRQLTQLTDAGLNGWVVDGESYSWFGIRGLRFLESIGAGSP